MTAGTITITTNYADAARRHLVDADDLLSRNRQANAGQLYGFAAECGLKALLLACGVPKSADGGIDSGHHLRVHIPKLHSRIDDDIVNGGSLIPDGRLATKYMAMVSGSIKNFSDWAVDHRYWQESALPLASVAAWQVAATAVAALLDQAKQDGQL
jgi:hypothetical protein